MKIVFTNDAIYAYARGAPSAVGGAERQQWLLARALASIGWSVTLAVREGLQAGDRINIEGTQFLGVGHGQVLSAWYRFISSERPDWWYWRSADHLWGAAVEIGKLVRARTIFAAAFDSDVQPREALTRRRRWWPLYAWGLSRTDKIFVQHGGQLSGLAPQWQLKAKVVPSIAGVSVAVKPHSERENYVSWVGMLRQPKRPDLLIEIAKKVPDVRFVVCGGPSLHRSAPEYGKRIISELGTLPNIEFLGQVSPESALEIIANSAVLLSTSDQEGFPNTFLHAWSSGTPVVSLKLDPDRVIEEARLGFISKDIDHAIVDLCALLDSPDRRDAIAMRALKYITETHSQEAVLTVFEQAIRAVPS